MSWPLLVAAVAFALVNGANTGATLLSVTHTLDSVGHLLALLLLALGVMAGPWLFGTAVAARFAQKLLPGGGAERSELSMLVAVVTTLAVVLALTRMSVPTGLTLAFVGSLAGVGAASGAGVPWASVLVVLGTMALAPVLGALIAAAVVAGLARRLHSRHVSRSLGRVHAVCFPALALGYGASDGQKMLAIAAVALGLSSSAGGDAVPAPAPLLVATGVLFALGSAIGHRRMSRRLGRGLLPVRPLYAVTSEIATTGALLGSAGVGAPAGVAQTLTGSLVGAGASQGLGRVRWPQVSAIAVAWLVTLPTTFGLSAAVTGGLRVGGVW